MHLKNYVYFFLLINISCSDPSPETAVETIKAEKRILPPGYTDLTGSSDLRDILCQCWENIEDWEEARRYGLTSSFESVFRGYCFYPDGTMVKYPRGYMEIGTWELLDKSKPYVISLGSGNDEDEKFKLAKLAPTELKIIGEGGGVQTYMSRGLRHDNVKSDPLHPLNNKWRMMPSRAENDEEIKDRLKGCIHFFVLYYDQMIETNSEVITFAGFPSCFKWYAGGIYLLKKEELRQKWIDCFYNKADAMKAYMFAEKLMRKKYKWPEKEKNWMKLNVAVLKQMEIQADSIN